MSTATKQTNAMHSAVSVDHYTPPAIVEAARFTLGAIDLDPASCELANRSVRAARVFTREEDGLSRSWGAWGLPPIQGPSRVFVNPPGGKEDGESIQKRWWRHAAREWLSGRVDALVWVAFKVDFLQVTQVDRDMGDPLLGVGCPPLPLDGAICYPRSRLAYSTPTLPDRPTKQQQRDHAETGLCVGGSPPHASAVIYLPSRRDPGGLARFVQAFTPIGAVRFDPRFIGGAAS